MDTLDDLLDEKENTLRYELYLLNPIDVHVIRKYKEFVSSIVTNLGTHFVIKKSAKQNSLHGEIRFFENIDDEWLWIYVLFELSKFDDDLVIKVFDDDGDILLTQAAEHLPEWLESSKSKNRVFIHKGKLHIIPEQVDLKDLLAQYQPLGTITQAAAHFIRKMNNKNTNEGTSQNEDERTAVETIANEAIQGAIQKQMIGMPDRQKWLRMKYDELDRIVFEHENRDNEQLKQKFNESLNLSSVMAMADEDLWTSPLSSAQASASSSSSWLTEQPEASDEPSKP